MFLWGHDRTFRHGLDADRQLAAKLVQDVLPPCTVEHLLVAAPLRVREMNLEMLFCFSDLFNNNSLADKIPLEEVPEAENHTSSYKPPRLSK